MTQPNESPCRDVRNPIVINWHVTEACNYHCGYCYAKCVGAGGFDTLFQWF